MTTDTAPLPRTVPALCAAGVLVVGQLYTVLPVLDELAGSWSTTPSRAGWATTAFGLGYAAGILLSGPLSDRFGRRRLIVGALALTALTTIAVAMTTGLAAGCALRALQGLTAAGFAPAALAHLAERIEPARRLTAMAWLTSSFLAAGVLGQIFSRAVAGIWNWRAVFLLSAVALAAGAVLLRRLLGPDDGPAARSAPAAYRAMGRQFTRPSLVLFLCAAATPLAGFVALSTALRGVGQPDTTPLLWAAALPAVALVPVAAPLLARVPAAHRVAGALLSAGTASGATALLATGGGPDPVALGALILVFTLGIAVAAPALVEVIGSAADPAARGAAVALYTFSLFTGASLGPHLAASVGGGLPAVAAVTGGVLYAGAALAATGRRSRDRRAGAEESADADTGGVPAEHPSPRGPSARGCPPAPTRKNGPTRRNTARRKEQPPHAIPDPRPGPRPRPRRSTPAGDGAVRRHRHRDPRHDGLRPGRGTGEPGPRHAPEGETDATDTTGQ